MNFLKSRYKKKEIDIVKEFLDDYIKGCRSQGKEPNLNDFKLSIENSLYDALTEERKPSETQTLLTSVQKGYYLQATEYNYSEIYVCRGIENDFDVTDRLLIFKSKDFAEKVMFNFKCSATFAHLYDWKLKPIKPNKFSDVYSK